MKRLPVPKKQEPVKKPQKSKFELAALLARMPRSYTTIEESFGKPIGKEEW